MRLFLTHSAALRANYYGAKALALLSACADVRLNEGDDGLDADALVHAAQGCDVIVSARVPAIPAEVFARLPSLAAVCRVAVDVRNIDLEAASHHGVLVTRATPGFGPAVAEWIVGVMIDHARGISAADAAYKAGFPPVIRMGRELRNATLGIIGYGTIGRYLGSLGRAFGMQVLACDPGLASGADGVEAVSFEALLERADFVVCLAPATPETAHLLNARAFSRMKPDACFINAARGELVDEDALLAALDAGTIAGCAVDVGSAQDQMPAPRVARHPRVIATPHIGGLTPAAAEHQAMDTVRQVRAMAQGQVPDGALNLAQAHRFRRRFLGDAKEPSHND